MANEVNKIGAYVVHAPAPGVTSRKVSAYGVYGPLANSAGFINIPSIFDHQVGWTVSNGAFESVSSKAAITPEFGSVFFSHVDTTAADCVLTQTATIPAGRLALVASGTALFRVEHLQTHSADKSPVQILLEALDSIDVVQASYSSSDLADGHNADWAHIFSSMPIPTSATKLRITLTTTYVVGREIGDTALQIYAADIIDRTTISNTTFTNGDAETGDISGWTTVRGTITADTSVVRTGTYSLQLEPYLISGTADTGTTAEQFVELSAGQQTAMAAGNGKINFAGYAYGDSLGSDTLEVIIHSYDADGELVDTTTTGVLNPPNSWTLFDITTTNLPTNTVAYRVSMRTADLGNSGGDIFFDDMTVTVTGGANPAAKAFQGGAAAVMSAPVPFKAFQGGAFTVLRDPTASRVTQGGAFVVLARGPTSQTKAGGAAAVLQYAPVFARIGGAAAVLRPAVPFKSFQAGSFAVLRQPTTRTFAGSVAAIIREPKARVRQSSLAAVLAPRPPSSRITSGATGVVLKPKPPIRSYQSSAFTVLKAPPPRSRARQGSAFTVLKAVPPVKAMQGGAAAILKAPPPVYARQGAAFAVLKTPPIAAIVKKGASFAVLQPLPARVTVGGSFAVLVPLSGVPAKVRIGGAFALLKYTPVVATGRRTVVIIE